MLEVSKKLMGVGNVRRGVRRDRRRDKHAPLPGGIKAGALRALNQKSGFWRVHLAGRAVFAEPTHFSREHIGSGPEARGDIVRFEMVPPQGPLGGSESDELTVQPEPVPTV